MSFNDGQLLTHASQFFGEAGRRLVIAGLAGVMAMMLAACDGSATAQTSVAGESSAQAQQQDATQRQAEAQDGPQNGPQGQDGPQDTGSGETTAVLPGAEDFSIDLSQLFSKRDLDASYDEKSAVQVSLSDKGTESTGSGVAVDGSTTTIGEEGTYVLSGKLSDGRVVVDVDDAQKVQLVLDGVDVTSSTGTALYVRNADKVFVTLADGTKNTLASTGEATDEDDHTLDGTVFASDDLTINGGGSLTVTSDKGHGIVAKDELTLVEGDVSVKAASHAIQAKDSVAVADGTYTLVGGQDGVHVEHDSNGEKGFAYVAGGTFEVTAGTDGFDTSNDLLIDGGSLTIAAGDDGLHSEYDLIINDGTIRVTESYEALEGARISLNGGDVDVTASDDGLNATGNPGDGASDDMPSGFGGKPGMGGSMGQGGEAPDSMPEDGQGQGPDGQMPEGERGPKGMPEGGRPQMPEDGQGQGPDGQRMGHRGGRPDMGDGDGAANMRMGGGPGFERDDTALIEIAGGKLVVHAKGDGLDSNGDLIMSGGEVYVSGPTSNGDGALDFGGSATISGGTILAVGSTGMAETFGEGSTQASMLVAVTGKAQDKVELKDGAGKVVASFTPSSEFGCVVASAPGMKEGETYTLSCGGESVDVTLDSISFRNVSGGMR